MTTSSTKTINISVIGVSGDESTKGASGVGKSLFCNRFVRPAADDFFIEHCSVLSQTDFGGSPVINNDHWLYWGDRLLTSDDNSQVLVRVVEQTEFLDDETYEPIACSSKSEEYCRRCCRLGLSSRDKLMYIQKEQLGLEADFPQHILADGKFNVDGFVLICDVSRNELNHSTQLANILTNLVKTKKPVVVAFSKCDEIDEEVKRNVMNMLVSRKELKNVHMPPIEISSIHDVNIEDVFHVIVGLCSRNYKHKRKPLSYYEAAHYVEQRNIQIKNAYANLLYQIMPMKSWPTQRFAWKRLLSDLDRHKDFMNFVQVYGSRAAFRMYEKYMCEAKEHWMTARLRTMLPQLPRIYQIIFEKIDISDIDWFTAREMIRSHALFDEFFQQIGSLGKQLDPITPEHIPREDVRLPAEILILPEAQQLFDSFRDDFLSTRLKERLEEDFECLLSETTTITPGQSLQDASLFLQGSSAFENLPLAQAADVYDRYQRMLVKRSELEFVECLLDHVELLVSIVFQSTSSTLTESISMEELAIIKDHLELDRRYRSMSKIFDLRDHLIYSMTSFYRMPSTSKCPSGARCVDAMIAHSLDRFFHRRNDQAYTHLIDIVVKGEDNLVAQFIAELSVFLRNEPFPCSSGSAFIRCFGEEETERRSAVFTEIFLIDSLSALESLKPTTNPIAPIIVVVCDPSCYDVLPMLHQQGASLAAKIGASFFGARGDTAYPVDDIASTNIASDCSSLLGRDQLMSICESICSSQLTLRKRDLRVQVSMMCGDQYSIDSLIANTFGDFEHISYFRPIVHPNLTAGGVVPIDVSDGEKNETRMRVEMAFCSYHSWFSPANAYKINSTQAHVLVYYVRRPASFAHARTAICRILDRRDLEQVTAKSILLIAVSDRQDSNDPLLIEGAELTESIGARFLSIHGAIGHNLTDEFIQFFIDIHHMILLGNSSEKKTRKKQKKENRGEEDGYASLVVDHVRPTSLHLTTMTTFQGRQGDIEKKTNNPTTRPSTLKMREGRISRSGPIILPAHRKSQPEIHLAPLATPEAVMIAPEYSLVKDALTSDEGLYETLDFTSAKAKPMNHLDLPEANVVPPLIGQRRPLRDSITSRRSSRTACVSSSPDPTSRLHRTSNLSPPTVLHTTTSSISTVRQSISAESLVQLMKEEKKAGKSRNRFVRKVATSFRFRKDKIEEKREEGRKKEQEEPRMSPEHIAAFREKMASRSLPQSPHMDRKSRLYTSLNNTSEKVSSAFSWLPSRSPKRSKDHTKSATYELNSSISSSTSTSSSTVAQGVISIDDTLESLCHASPSGIPIYVEKCVSFIENNGGFEQEGLYRVPGNQSHLADVERKFLQTGEFDVSSVDIPVHVAATALKNFFSCLPAPLIPVELHAEIKMCTVVADEQEKITQLREILAKLPKPNRDVLSYLTSHLTKVSNSPKTVMDQKNLSKVWFPTLFRPAFDSYEALSSGMVAYQLAMEAIFINSDRIL